MRKNQPEAPAGGLLLLLVIFHALLLERAFTVNPQWYKLLYISLPLLLLTVVLFLKRKRKSRSEDI